VGLSNDGDDGLKPDTPADQKKMSAGDDAGDEGVSSAEPNTPNSISSGMLKQFDPSTASQVSTNVPPSGSRGRKHPTTTRLNKPILQVDQVMTQVALPLYHGPRSPLDLVAIKIIFGHIFEVFRCISQATTAGAMTTDDDRPPKRSHQPSLRKLLVPR
jgi:hypothetical protein